MRQLVNKNYKLTNINDGSRRLMIQTKAQKNILKMSLNLKKLIEDVK